MDSQTRKEFYLSAQGMTESKIKALFEREVTVHKKTFDGWQLKGEFKPLSVWQEQGYDVETIKRHARPQDIRTNREYGWEEYRVVIQTNDKRERTEVNDKINLSKAKRSRKLSKAKRSRKIIAETNPTRAVPREGDTSEGSDFEREVELSGEDSDCSVGGQSQKKKDKEKVEKERTASKAAKKEKAADKKEANAALKKVHESFGVLICQVR